MMVCIACYAEASPLISLSATGNNPYEREEVPAAAERA